MMDKRADRSRQAPSEKLRPSRDLQKEPLQRGGMPAALLPAVGMDLRALGVPLYEQSSDTVMALASKLGNAALHTLLRDGGGFETMAFQMPWADELPENPAHAVPPERIDRTGFRHGGLALDPFPLDGMLERTAPAVGANLFEAVMGGET